MTQLQPVTLTRSEPPRSRTAEVLCAVCHRPVDGAFDSTCRNCDRPVHIAWTQEQPEPECSRIAPTSNTCGVSFVCIPCYRELGFE